MNKNNLIVIENGQLTTYMLDDKLTWELGRPTKDNQPDIKLHSVTISRRHGKFQNMDGMWFYVDYTGKNGTVYNDKHIESGMSGRRRPIMLHDGDTFVFGGGKTSVISSKTAWALYSRKNIDNMWRVEDTKGFADVEFSDGTETSVMSNPQKGSVAALRNGMAIYMGDITYLCGDIEINGK